MNCLSRYRPHSVLREDRADGTVLLRSGYDLGPVVTRTGDWLHHWAEEAPDRVFLAERHGAGWREESYRAVLGQVRAVAAALLGRGLGPDAPIMVLSGNGVDHGILALACQYAGIPLVPVAEQYSLIHGAHGRLRHAMELIEPKLVYTVDADHYAEALALDIFEAVEVVASRPGRSGATAFADLLKGDPGVDVDAAFAAVTPDTVVKILMTSGSTSSPKGVLTTHRMMCANQVMLAESLPFLRDRAPRIIDWLPWNHVFGGSHNFNMMLANGGSLYIDDGKPVKGLFERSVENMRMISGTMLFNVPVGFSMMLDALRKDDHLRRMVFSDLDMLFYAGASLPQEVWDGFERMAIEARGAVPLMTSSWGLTETAPATMIQQEPTDRSGVIGVPMTGVRVKLIPEEDGRFEVRVKGPNITPGYFRAPEKTAEAFDEEGFFITGDAMSFVDPADPNRGMKFEGRISEDFKLTSGTWVRAGQLRMEVLACLTPLAQDVVITGADRDEIGVMIFPNREVLANEGFDEADQGGALSDPRLLSDIHRCLAERALSISGSSSRIARAMVLAEPPSMAEGEMTAKGNLNFRKVLGRRADLLERLYAPDDPCVTRI
jgi:feruloyl-CoA synthase